MLEKVVMQSGGADNEAEALKNKILSAKDTIKDRKNVYYVSENGDDSNDGLSPEKAIKSFKRLAEITLSEGDAILFERGSVFRQEEMLWIRSDDICIGAYGEGEKPLVLGSVRDYADPAIWEKTEEENVWVVKVPKGVKEVGGVFFNDAESIGEWKFTREELKEEGDFYNDNEAGLLYLYYKENPGASFDNIEISTTNASLRASYISGIYSENIYFKYFTFGAFHLGEIKDIYVTNCVVGWSGGGLYSADREKNTHCRYGNAFQAWYLAENINVNNCWIYQQFDAAVTFQGFGDTPARFVNIEFSDNLIEYSSMNIEFWVGRKDVDRHLSTIDNILYKGNIIRFSGYGWAGRQREKMDNQAALLGWNYAYETMNNFVIRDNIIDCADCHMIYTKSPKEQPGLEVYNNTYYQKPTSGFHDCVEIVKGLKIMPVGEKELKEAIATFEEKPKLVKWLDK